MSDPLMSTPSTNPDSDPLQRVVNRSTELQNQIRTGNMLMNKLKLENAPTRPINTMGGNG